MPFIEKLLVTIIATILKQSTEKTWRGLKRDDKVLKILDAAGLKPDGPDADFKSVYAHTLVEYGVDQPEAILNFFRHKQIMNAFETSYGKGDLSILNYEASNLIKWSRIGDELRESGIDWRLEFASFSLVFNEMTDRTRTPVEARNERKLDEIIRMISEPDLGAVRAKNIEMSRGSLPDQLRSWFEALGYTFEGHSVQTEKYCEWILLVPARRGVDRILVRFIRDQAELKDMDEVRSAVEKHDASEGWLVAARRKAKSVNERIGCDDRVLCYTFDELLDEHADFTRYFNWLELFIKRHDIEKYYIPLACARSLADPVTREKVDHERYGKEEGWIEGYIDRWLEDPCKEHISILGEFGTGKTWFSHYYAYRVMKKYLEAKEKGLQRPRLPLVIQLRDYAKALDAESLFSDFFFRKHEIPLPGYSAFRQLNRMGRLLLIFDGFDEMASRLDRQKVINNFWELARVVVPGAKAVLTCRTEHFPNAKEGRDLLNAKLKASTANLTGDPPQFEILELEPFAKDQIRQALSKRTDKKTVDLLMEHDELLDLASRPVMLEFMVEALPDIEAGKPVDLSRIYLYAVNEKLERDFKAGRTFTSLADKIFFMSELSWEMMSEEEMSLNYRLFPDRLKNLFGPVVSKAKDLDHWQHDMRGNTLLIRNDDGDYKPAHRSLLEFFTAYRIVAGLGMLPSDFVAPARRQSNVDTGLAPVDYTWNGYFKRELNEIGQAIFIPPLKLFLPENTDALMDAAGRMGDNVLRFIHEMTNIREVREKFHVFIAEILEAFKKGDRDPAKDQDILKFVLRFRVLSLQWEERAGKGDAVRRFWKDRHEQEIGRAVKTRIEAMSLERSGSSPIRIDMIEAPAGTFLMGDEADGPVHRVRITKPFLPASVPVTQELYQAVMGDNPSRFQGSDLPVESVSWFDAVKFCNRLSERMNLNPAYRIEDQKVSWNRESFGFRLPTEAEWEYACRAGSTTRYSWGDLESNIGESAWYMENSQGTTQPVGQKKPNSWGLFDMHGNVWEWVWDWYDGYPNQETVDPVGSRAGSARVVRGGCWLVGALDCRSAIRFYVEPGLRGADVGFRLSRSVALGS